MRTLLSMLVPSAPVLFAVFFGGLRRVRQHAREAARLDAMESLLIPS